MAKIGTLSASRCMAFLICPRRYFYQYVEGIRKLPTALLTLGSAFHTTTEQNYRQKAETKTDLPTPDLLEFFSAEFDSRETDFQQNDPGAIKDSGIGILKSYQEIISPKVQPIEVETAFVIRFTNKDWNFQGKIDLVAEDGDAGEILRETKTTTRKPSKPKPGHLIQVCGYTAARRKQTQNPLRTCIDYAVRNKNSDVVSFPVSIDAEDERFFWNYISAIALGIEAEAWVPNRTGNLCSRKWCGYWQECERDIGGRVRD